MTGHACQHYHWCPPGSAHPKQSRCHGQTQSIDAPNCVLSVAALVLSRMFHVGVSFTGALAMHGRELCGHVANVNAEPMLNEWCNSGQESTSFAWQDTLAHLMRSHFAQTVGCSCQLRPEGEHPPCCHNDSGMQSLFPAVLALGQPDKCIRMIISLTLLLLHTI